MSPRRPQSVAIAAPAPAPEPVNAMLARRAFDTAPATARLLADRWLEWGPFVRAWQQRRNDHSSAAYARLRDRHRARLLLAIACGLTMPVIRRNAIDDPRPPDDSTRLRIQAAIQRQHTKKGSPQ